MWILQKGLCEGTQACQRGLYVWYMLQIASIKKKKKEMPGNKCK
jgi:hypothetical protein